MNGEHCTDATSPNNDPLFVAAFDNDALELGFVFLSGSTAVNNNNDDNDLLMSTLTSSKLH